MIERGTGTGHGAKIIRCDKGSNFLKANIALKKMREKGESLDSIKFEKDTLSPLIKAGGLDDQQIFWMIPRQRSKISTWRYSPMKKEESSYLHW